MSGHYLGNVHELVQQLSDLGVKDKDVLECIKTIPRHVFVNDVLQHKAYENNALPIGQGQTISQPFMVAKMTEVLKVVGVKGNILEVGTGSGYQTAVLAKLFPHIFSIERIKSLQIQARRRLNQLDIYNVSMKHSDGWQGWNNKAPFAGILVAAAAEKVPNALLDQLAEGGAMVIPVGKEKQCLMLFVKRDGHIVSHELAPVRFVPLISGALA